ncbi:MAG: hypothetical protein U9O96_08195 [Candidatus Thermoplasmatota archaeon]|nr:hypothetical protein [Candidatus Thermoplasmatota archaeon]
MRRTAFLFLIILFLLMAYSLVEHDKKDPDMDYILKNFEKYNNTEVSFGGKVVEANNGEIEICLTEPPYNSLTIGTKNISLKKGDIVEVTGVLDGKGHVTAKKIMVSSSWKSSLIFIRSLPAIPFAIYFLFRNWKFNFKKFMFEGKNA